MLAVLGLVAPATALSAVCASAKMGLPKWAWLPFLYLKSSSLPVFEVLIIQVSPNLQVVVT